MSNDEWAEEAATLMRRFVVWWDSESPDRHLGFAEAHEMANHVLVAKFLLAEHQARRGGDPEEK